MITEDLDVFFADFGVPASAGANSATVLLDMPDRAILGDRQIGTEYAITAKATDLPGLKHGDAITVANVGYSVRVVTLLDDGVLKHVTLSKA
ncbi:MAG: hypothetical protein PHY45_02475 [Rhodocyclaceae bacterium]|nr:hypothetical protein [Rhodocyclaceae bacterium]